MIVRCCRESGSLDRYFVQAYNLSGELRVRKRAMLSTSASLLGATALAVPQYPAAALAWRTQAHAASQHLLEASSGWAGSECA